MNFSRGRGIYNSNKNKNLSVGFGPFQTFINSIVDMNLKDVHSSLVIMAKDDKETRLGYINQLLSMIYQSESLAASLMLIYPTVIQDFNTLMPDIELRRELLHDLQVKYESIEEWKDKPNFYIRNYAYLLVTIFLSRNIKTGFKFMMTPILDAFKRLLFSTDPHDIQAVAILYLSSWKHLKYTSEQDFESFSVYLRKAMLSTENLQAQKTTLLFMIDITKEETDGKLLCSPLSEYYRNNMSCLTKEKIRAYCINEHVKRIFIDDKISEPLSDIKISDKVENAPENSNDNSKVPVTKQAVPRAILGAGASDNENT